MKPTVTRIYTENAEFQQIETLRRNRIKRNRSRTFFVEGVRAINQALLNNWPIHAFVYTRESRLSDWAEGVLAGSDAKIHYELPAHLIQKLSQKEETSELIAIVAMAADDLSRIPVRDDFLAVVFDRPSNPGNLGTVIRSCDALRVAGMIVTGHSVDLYDPETIRASTGSFFSVPTVRLSSHRELVPWLDELRGRLPRLQVIGTSAKAPIPISQHDFTAPSVFLIGNENHGLSENYRALCDVTVTIPMYGSATSLNVACATSILLYEVARQRG
jgi:23S rRNA (uridine2479-2'-O)-methyltransferase